MPINPPSLITPPDQNFASPPDPHKSPRSKRWLWFLLALIVVGGGLGYYGLNQWQSTGGSKRGLMGRPTAVAVKWQVLEPVPVESSSTLVGAIEAEGATTITSEVEGRLTAILVKEGDRLKQGQVLMSLDDTALQTELRQAQADLARNQAVLAELEAGTRTEEVESARASLQESQARLGNAKRGASPEEIAQAQAQIRVAQAEAELAQERVKRFQTLQEEGVIALDAYEQRLKEQRQALANLEAAQRRLSQLQKSRNADIESLGAEVEQKQQTLRRLEAGPRPEILAQARASVNESLARISTIQVKLQKTKILSPFGGTVGYIPVKVGDYVQAGATLTTLTENQSLQVNLAVPLAEAPQLRLGLAVQMLDSENQAIATGEISFISPTVDNNAQTVLARASFANPSHSLLHQQLIETRIIWRRSLGLVVPATAVSRLGGETFVYILGESKEQKDGKPQRLALQKNVRLGPLQGSNYQVLSGVKAGDKLIISGLMNLQDGSPVVEAGALPKAEQRGGG